MPDRDRKRPEDRAGATPRPAGLRAQSKDRKRRRLLEAARVLFERNGFEATTTRAIATRAGVGVGTLFLYFPEKRDLLFQLFLSEVHAIERTAFTSVPRRDLAAQLAHVFGTFYAHYARDPRLSRAFMKELIFVEQGERAEFSAFTGGFLLRVVALVEDAKRAGEVAAAVAADRVATHAYSLYLFGLIAWQNGGFDTPRTTQAWLQGELELLLAGIAADRVLEARRRAIVEGWRRPTLPA